MFQKVTTFRFFKLISAGKVLQYHAIKLSIDCVCIFFFDTKPNDVCSFIACFGLGKIKSQTKGDWIQLFSILRC